MHLVTSPLTAVLPRAVQPSALGLTGECSFSQVISEKQEAAGRARLPSLGALSYFGSNGVRSGELLWHQQP